MTSTGCAAHIGAFHKYCYWWAEIRVSHAGVIRFTPLAAATPPAEGNPSLPLSPLLACSPTCNHHHQHQPLFLSFRESCASHFSFSLSLFLLVSLTRCSAFAVPFLFPPRNRRVIPPSSSLLFRSFSRRGNRLSLRRTCGHSSRTIERKRGRKRYFSRTARTSASAVNSGRPDRGENFAKYRSNASRASLGSGRSDHRINRTVIGYLYRVRLDLALYDCYFRQAYIFWVLDRSFVNVSFTYRSSIY